MALAIWCPVIHGDERDFPPSFQWLPQTLHQRSHRGALASNKREIHNAHHQIVKVPITDARLIFKAKDVVAEDAEM